MKPLIIDKEITKTEIVVNEEALKEIAIALLQNKVKTVNYEAETAFDGPYRRETTFIVDLLVGDGYEVTIKNTRRG